MRADEVMVPDCTMKTEVSSLAMCSGVMGLLGCILGFFWGGRMKRHRKLLAAAFFNLNYLRLASLVLLNWACQGWE